MRHERIKQNYIHRSVIVSMCIIADGSIQCAELRPFVESESVVRILDSPGFVSTIHVFNGFTKIVNVITLHHAVSPCITLHHPASR